MGSLSELFSGCLPTPILMSESGFSFVALIFRLICPIRELMLDDSRSLRFVSSVSVCLLAHSQLVDMIQRAVFVDWFVIIHRASLGNVPRYLDKHGTPHFKDPIL